MVAEAHRLALGSAQWSARYGVANTTGPPDDEELLGILDDAFAVGISTIDTARGYAGSEARIGSILGDDDRWRVVTKLSPDLGRAAGSHTGASARKSLAESRSALRRDFLDAVLLHREEHREVAGGEVWNQLRAEKDSGRVGRIGVSVRDVVNAERFLDDPTIDVLQVPGSLADRRLADRGFFTVAAEAGKEVFLRSVFLQGALLLPATRLPPHLAPLGAVLDRVDRWSADRGIDRYDACLAVARQSLPVNVVVGCESRDQVRRLLEGWGHATTLDEDAVDGLLESLPTLEDEVLDPWRWPT